MTYLAIEANIAIMPTDAQYVDITFNDKVVAHCARRRHNEKGFGEWNVTLYDERMNKVKSFYSDNPVNRVRLHLNMSRL